MEKVVQVLLPNPVRVVVQMQEHAGMFGSDATLDALFVSASQVVL